MEVGYFGTDLTSAGHYFWELGDHSLYSSRKRANDFPFNPEALPYDKQILMRNGEVGYYRFAGFIIIAIVGSCKDQRPGSKSVFFTTHDIKLGEFREYLKNHPVASKMFTQMQFEIKW